MKYKIYEGLSDYAIGEDGSVIETATGQVIPYLKEKGEKKVKLITDEVFAISKGKKKAIRIVRRYTKEEVLKMYERSKKVHQDEPLIRKMDVVGDNSSVDPNAGNPAVESGWSEKTPDQVAASKRTVKSNPKATKALTAKVQKAIQKEVDNNIQSDNPDPRLVMNKLKGGVVKPAKKYPFVRINGVDYASARAASKELGIAVNTVLKKAKANKDGWFYIEKEEDESSN